MLEQLQRNDVLAAWPYQYLLRTLVLFPYGLLCVLRCFEVGPV